MPNQMNVDPVHLRLTGRTLRSAAADAHSGFRSSTSGLGDAAGGLFDSSRKALDAKAYAWRDVTRDLAGRVDEHAGALHIDANLYEHTEKGSSAAVHDAASGLARRPRLNLEP